MHCASIGEHESLLFFDDTYKMEVYNIASKEIVGSLPYSSFQVKCVLVAESKLFIGMSTGEIYMYDAFALELLDKTTTCRQATPISMTMQSTGTILVGMSSGSLEVFTF